MPFTPPLFVNLKFNTLELNKKYSISLGRYKVVEDNVQQPSLEILIARTNDVIKCGSDRKSQIAVFTQLVDELRQIPKENSEKVRQGTLFLLGALIHRYFRLINDYKGSPYMPVSWSFFTSAVNCKLFIAIRTALQFTPLEQLTRLKQNWRLEDLKTLDVVTIVTALEVFQKNMLLEDEKKSPRYMKYPHFADPANHFEKYLQDIIDEHSKRGDANLKRFKLISFLESLTTEIDKQHQLIDKDLQSWCKGIIKENKDLKIHLLNWCSGDIKEQKNFNPSDLDEEKIKLSIKKYVKEEKSINRIYDLITTPKIKEKLGSIDSKDFYEIMSECNSDTCSYKLFGGYALLLHKYKNSFDKNLLFIVQKNLGLEGLSVDSITKEELFHGVKFLQYFMDCEPAAALDYEFFGGKSKFDTLLLVSEQELSPQVVVKQKEETNSLTY